MEKKRQPASIEKDHEPIKPLMERLPRGMYKEMFLSSAETLREQYEKEGNSIWLLYVFTQAVGYKLDIPSWVISKLDEVFQKYLYDGFEKKEYRSIDRLLGFKKGKGQAPATIEFERRDRNSRLMLTIGMLIQRGMGPTDASKIAFERYIREENFSPLSPKKIYQMYYRWKKQLDRINKYEESPIEILEFVPESIKRKYPKIFETSI